MNGRLGSALTRADDVSAFGKGNRHIGDVILMSWKVVDVLWLILLFLDTSEKSLLMSAQRLNNTKSRRNVNDLIICSPERKGGLVSVASKSVDMINLPSFIGSFFHL